MNGVFVALNRVTVLYSVVVGIYRLRCQFMGNRLVCESRLLGRLQCASVQRLEVLEQITQCPIVFSSHIQLCTFEFENRKVISDDFLHLLLFNWLSFALMTYGNEVYLNVVNIRCACACLQVWHQDNCRTLS